MREIPTPLAPGGRSRGRHGSGARHFEPRHDEVVGRRIESEVRHPRGDFLHGRAQRRQFVDAPLRPPERVGDFAPHPLDPILVKKSQAVSFIRVRRMAEVGLSLLEPVRHLDRFVRGEGEEILAVDVGQDGRDHLVIGDEGLPAGDAGPFLALRLGCVHVDPERLDKPFRPALGENDAPFDPAALRMLRNLGAERFDRFVLVRRELCTVGNRACSEHRAPSGCEGICFGGLSGFTGEQLCEAIGAEIRWLADRQCARLGRLGVVVCPLLQPPRLRPKVGRVPGAEIDGGGRHGTHPPERISVVPTRERSRFPRDRLHGVGHRQTKSDSGPCGAKQEEIG